MDGKFNLVPKPSGVREDAGQPHLAVGSSVLKGDAGKRIVGGLHYSDRERAGKLSKKGTSKGTAHIYAMATRKTVKIFLAHLWAEWRRLEDLPVTEPYAIAQLGHSDYISAPSTQQEGK